MDIPRNSVPRDVGEIEDEVFGFVVFGPPQHLGPVFQIGPCFLGRTSTEGWETGQELEKDAPQRPVVDRVGVWLST